jgi:hypothetical protein
MGEILKDFALKFNGSIRLEEREERLTTEAGALLLREVDERLGLSRWLSERLKDPRDAARITHPLEELVRTHLLLLGQGWRDQDDADELRQDAALRLGVSGRKSTGPLEPREGAPQGLASQPTLSRTEGILSGEGNRQVLSEGLAWGVGRRLRAKQPGGQKLPRVTMDVDSLPAEVHGEQPGSAYNGHYHMRIYHPLVAVLAESGDIVDVQLREGQVHTAQGAWEFIEPLLERVEEHISQQVALRMDAGFPEDTLLSRLEHRGTQYVARVRNTSVLKEEAAVARFLHLGLPRGEPQTSYYEWQYQAQGWSRARRAVMVLQQVQGELFPNAFWLVTSWTAEQMPAADLLEHYRQRGTAEAHLGELMDVLAPALSSAPRPKRHYRGQLPVERTTSVDSFAHNQVRLLLNALAYNLVHATRALLEDSTGEGWSLLRVRQRVLKVASRLLVHSRRVILVIGQQAAGYWRALWHTLRSFDAAHVT